MRIGQVNMTASTPDMLCGCCVMQMALIITISTNYFA